MCSRAAVAVLGFRNAARLLEDLAQIRLSVERLCQIAEREGQRVGTAQAQGRIAPSLMREQSNISAEGPTRIYVRAERVKVPMVTAAEKAKRHARRGPKRSGSCRRRMRRRADNAYKEFKITTPYERSNAYHEVLATAGNHQEIGGLIWREAQRRGLNRFE